MYNAQGLKNKKGAKEGTDVIVDVGGGVADNGMEILEAGELEEKKKSKEDDYFSIAVATKKATVPPTATFSDTPIKMNRLHDALHNAPNALYTAPNEFNKAAKASAQDTVSNLDDNNDGVISEAGEVDEKNNNKESDKYAIAGGTNEKHAPPTATLSDQHKTPWVDADMDKKGVAANVNINNTTNLFLYPDLSDQSKASPEDAINDNKGPTTSRIDTLFLDSDTS